MSGKTSETTNLWLMFWLMAPLLLYVATAPCASGQTTMRRQSVPIAIDIDGTLQRSGFYFQFEARWYSVPLDEFTATKHDAAETACAATLNAIRTRNYTAFKKSWEIPTIPLATGVVVPSQGGQMTDAGFWLDGYYSAFDFQHVTMVGEVLVGSHSVCFWDANTQSGPRRNAFIVRGGQQGTAKVSGVTSWTKLESVLLDSMEAARKDPQAYKPVYELNLQYRYPIPIEGKGNSGDHPIFLQFNGLPLDFDLAQRQTMAPSPVIEFYRTAYQALRNNDVDTFTGMFTPRSGALLKQLLKGQTEGLTGGQRADQKRALQRGLLGPQYVKFVMNGDPVFLLFLSSEKGKAWNPANSSHRYVVKDRASGKFALANLSYENALDQVLDSSLFDPGTLVAPVQKPETPVSPKKAAGGNITRK